MWSKKIRAKVIDIALFKSKMQFIGCYRSGITRISENKISGQVQGVCFENTRKSCKKRRFLAKNAAFVWSE